MKSLPHQIALARRLPAPTAFEVTYTQAVAVEELLCVLGPVAGNWRTVAGLDGFLFRRRDDASGAGVFHVKPSAHVPAARGIYFRATPNGAGGIRIDGVDVATACALLGVDMPAYLAAHAPA